MLWTKVVFYEKLGGWMSLSPSAVELGASKDCHFLNILMHWNGNVHFCYKKYQKMLQTRIIQNEISYRKLPECNSLSPLPRNGAKGLQRLQFLKYYDTLELERWLFLGLNAAKSTDCTEKCVKQKLYKIKFSQKTWWAHVLISPRSGARGHQRFVIFEIMHWNGKLGSL